MSEWLAEMKAKLAILSDRHLVPDWRECHKFASNLFSLMLSITGLILENGVGVIPAKYLLYAGIVNFVLRMWGQNKGGTDATEN